jgi:iron complex outermembrane recepter protein
MSRHALMKGASACALLLSLSSEIAEAQQSLPTIEVGAPRRVTATRGGNRRTPAVASNSVSGNGQQASGQGSGTGPTGPAAAKPLTENNTTYRPESAISATKTNTPIMETPASIQVVPRAVMRDQQVTELSQAVNNVSGVIAADERQANAQTFWIRGFLTYQYYLDGVRMASDYSQTAQEMANVDRVEVLKGPASILYGRAEPGGIINVVTKVPQEKAFTSIQQQAGSWFDYRTTMDTTGPLTADNTLLYRVNIAYQNNKNFDNVVAARNIFFAPKFRWNIDAHNFIDAFVTYNYRMWPDVSDAPSITGPGPNSQNPLYAFAFGTTPLSFLPRSFNANPPWSRLNQDEIVFGVSSSHDLNESWNFKTKFQSQLVGYTHPYAGPSSWDPEIPFTLNNFPFLTTGWNTYSYYGNFLLTGNFSTSVINHTLLIGGDYQKWGQEAYQYFQGPNSLGSIPNTYIFAPIYSSFPPLTFDPTTQLHQAGYVNWEGIYIQDQMKLPYDLFLMAGGRFDHAVDYDSVGQTILSDARKVTPRVGLLWRPIPQASVYGSYVQNFGVPFVPFNTQNKLPPQTAEQLEVGVKTELFDQRLTATLAVYNIKKQHVATPSTDPILAAEGVYTSTGEVRNKGIELDVAGEIIPGWKIIGGYSYINSLITKDSGLIYDNYSQYLVSIGALDNPILLSINGNQGKQLGGVPRHSGSLWTTYEIQDGDLRGFKFGGGMLARSLAQGDNFNDFHTAGYATLQLMAAYETKILGSKTTFQLNGNNMLDTRYYSVIYPGPYSTITGAPRNFKASVRVEF